MATFLMKKRWAPGTPKGTPKNQDDRTEASVSGRHGPLADNDDDDDDPLLGRTIEDATRRTPPRFRLRTLATASNNGNNATGNPIPTTFRDKFQSLLVKRDVPPNCGNASSITTRSMTRTTNNDEEQQSSTPLDFQSLEGDEEGEDFDYQSEKSSLSHHGPMGKTNLHRETDCSPGLFVADESYIETSMEHELSNRHSFSTVNSDIFLNVSQDVSEYTLSIRFQDVLQLEISNESTILSSMGGKTSMMEIQYDPPTTDSDIDGPVEQQEHSIDWSAADFEASWTGIDLSDNDHHGNVQKTDQTTSEANLMLPENMETLQDASHATLPVFEPSSNWSVSSPRASDDSQQEPIIPPTPDFPLDPVINEIGIGDAPPEPIETTVSTQCQDSQIIGVTNIPFEIMTPKTPMEMNMGYVASDILKGPPRRRSSFADVPSLSPQTPHLENGCIAYSYTGIIFGPVQLPSLQCFENQIQKLDLTEEEPDEMTTTAPFLERNMDQPQEPSTVPNRKGKHAMDLPPMPALS